MCKRFFSSKFQLLLTFNGKGLVSGKICPYTNLPSISSEVSGLYFTVNTHICLSFSCTFRNPNLVAETHTTFSGELMHYDSAKECLILKWLMFQDLMDLELIDTGSQILFDSKYVDEEIETRRAQLYLNRYALQFGINAPSLIHAQKLDPSSESLINTKWPMERG